MALSPIGFLAVGGMGTVANVVFKRLASLNREARKTYSSTLHWLRCRLNLSLLRSGLKISLLPRLYIPTRRIHRESIDLARQVPAYFLQVVELLSLLYYILKLYHHAVNFYLSTQYLSMRYIPYYVHVWRTAAQ